MKYKVGDTVKLVSKRPLCWNPEGLMDCFLGSIQTIKHFDSFGRPEFESPDTYRWSFQMSDIESLVTPYPKVMWVSDSGDNPWLKRVVFAEKKGKFLAWMTAETIEAAENETETISWRQAKDVLETVEVTIPEIAKAMGLHPEQIRIKE